MKFMDFFADQIEYPGDPMAGEIMPPGTFYLYVSSTLLNGFVNYLGAPERAYVLCHYHGWNEPLDELAEISVREPPINGPWKTRTFLTKSEIYACVTEPGRLYHIDLSLFRDDVLALFRCGEFWWLLWFDQDVSDCCIGRFATAVNDATVRQLFDVYARGLVFSEEPRILPPHVFTGWVKF